MHHPYLRNFENIGLSLFVIHISYNQRISATTTTWYHKLFHSYILYTSNPVAMYDTKRKMTDKSRMDGDILHEEK